MAAIRNLCQQGILLNNGKILIQANAQIVIESYVQKCQDKLFNSLINRKDRKGRGDIKFTSVSFKNENKEEVYTLYSGQNVSIVLYFENILKQDLKNFHIAIGIDNYLGDRIALLSSEITNEDFLYLPVDINNIEIHIKQLPLNQGKYSFTIYSTLNSVVVDWVQNAVFFNVESGDFYHSGKLPPPTQGNFLLDYHFRVPSCSNM